MPRMIHVWILALSSSVAAFADWWFLWSAFLLLTFLFAYALREELPCPSD